MSRLGFEPTAQRGDRLYRYTKRAVNCIHIRDICIYNFSYNISRNKHKPCIQQSYITYYVRNVSFVTDNDSYRIDCIWFTWITHLRGCLRRTAANNWGFTTIKLRNIRFDADAAPRSRPSAPIMWGIHYTCHVGMAILSENINSRIYSNRGQMIRFTNKLGSKRLIHQSRFFFPFAFRVYFSI